MVTIHVCHFVCALLFVLCAVACPAAESPDDVLVKDIELMKSGLESGHLDNLSELGKSVEGSLFIGHMQARRMISDLADKNTKYLSVFGPYVGVESLGYLKLGDGMRTYVFVWKMKEAAVLWYFNYYRGDSSARWRLVSFASEPMTTFLDKTEKIFSLGVPVR